MAPRRKPGGKSKPPEARATRPRRKRPRLCKRYAASARRRSCRSSLLRAFFERVHLLNYGLKARFVAHAVVKLIAVNPPENRIAVFIRFLQPIQSFLLLAQP